MFYVYKTNSYVFDKPVLPSYIIWIYFFYQLIIYCSQILISCVLVIVYLLSIFCKSPCMGICYFHDEPLLISCCTSHLYHCMYIFLTVFLYSFLCFISTFSVFNYIVKNLGFSLDKCMWSRWYLITSINKHKFTEKLTDAINIFYI